MKCTQTWRKNSNQRALGCDYTTMHHLLYSTEYKVLKTEENKTYYLAGVAFKETKFYLLSFSLTWLILFKNLNPRTNTNPNFTLQVDGASTGWVKINQALKIGNKEHISNKSIKTYSG